MGDVDTLDQGAATPQPPVTDPFDDRIVPPAAASAGLTKVVVAIHGIGKQLRSDTIRSVASRFGETCNPPVPVMPLGHFSIAEGSAVRWSVLDAPDDAGLARIGFAEVYWADIPDRLVQANDTLEETKDWARTVVGRAQSMYDMDVVRFNRATGKAEGEVSNVDFQQGIDAIDTLVEGIDVIEKLCLLGRRAGLVDFEVGGLLRDYVGDVQTVTEFPVHRNRILFRFHAVLNGIVAAFMQQHGRVPEIHLVAHSEGTVISLLALLQALSSQQIDDPDGKGKAEGGDWVRHLRGFMTIGSPIDKHIALWPRLWREFWFETVKVDTGWWIHRPGDNEGLVLQHQIKWRNYFDYGDPVGFRLDAARNWLDSVGCDVFEFKTELHDVGFSRYWLPGKAHVDYWQDPELFRHFIDTVVQPPTAHPPAPIPASRPWCDALSRGVPYVLSFALHLGAVVVFLQAMSLLNPPADPRPDAAAGIGGWMAMSVAIALFLLTVGARMPCLTKPGLRWEVAGLACAAGAVAASMPAWETASMLLLAAVLVGGLITWLMRLRRPLRGRSVLLWCAALACAALWIGAGGGLQGASLTAAGALLAFVYLWWLSIILFDLAFVWHRYIRNSVAVRHLRAWNQHHDAKQDPYWGLGTNLVQQRIDKAHKAAGEGESTAAQPAWSR